MKILATGASGQLARALTGASLPRGWHLHAVGRPALDITSFASVQSCMRAFAPDIVINTAAYTAVDKAEEDREAAYAVNCDGAQYMARVCAEQGIPFIHISTDYVFDGTKKGAWVETDPTNPLGVYGASKLAGEEAVRAANPRHIILRTSWVFSPWGHNFVRTMLRLACEREEVAVVSDQHGCPTYAPHLADALLLIAQHVLKGGNSVWGTYHLAGDGEATWYDFAVHILDCSQEMGGPAARVRPIGTADFPTRARRPANSCLDCSLVEETFSVRLPHWSHATRECVRYILQKEKAK